LCEEFLDLRIERADDDEDEDDEDEDDEEKEEENEEEEKAEVGEPVDLAMLPRRTGRMPDVNEDRRSQDDFPPRTGCVY